MDIGAASSASTMMSKSRVAIACCRGLDGTRGALTGPSKSEMWDRLVKRSCGLNTKERTIMSDNQNLPKPDRALRRLDRLVGAWSMEGNLVGSDEKNISHHLRRNATPIKRCKLALVADPTTGDLPSSSITATPGPQRQATPVMKHVRGREPVACSVLSSPPSSRARRFLPRRRRSTPSERRRSATWRLRRG